MEKETTAREGKFRQFRPPWLAERWRQEKAGSTWFGGRPRGAFRARLQQRLFRGLRGVVRCWRSFHARRHGSYICGHWRRPRNPKKSSCTGHETKHARCVCWRLFSNGTQGAVATSAASPAGRWDLSGAAALKRTERDPSDGRAAERTQRGQHAGRLAFRFHTGGAHMVASGLRRRETGLDVRQRCVIRWPSVGASVMRLLMLNRRHAAVGILGAMTRRTKLV